MTRGQAARATRVALLVLSTLTVCCYCCSSVAAQSHGQRPVHAASHADPQYRSHASQAPSKRYDAAADDEDDDGDDDWDFMSDDAILSLAAQQQPTAATASGVTCAQTLAPEFLNDDYCDCADGSDEPLTAACSGVVAPGQPLFQCRSGGSDHTISPSLVHDGVCDCCDGSDEPAGYCPNTCAMRQQQRIDVLQTRLTDVRAALRIHDRYIAQYDQALESLRLSLEDAMAVASVVERAFAYQQRQFAGRETRPTPRETQQLASMHAQLQQRQYRAFVAQRVIAPTTFGDRDWKAPFATLVGRCFDLEVNEKQLKGGSANVVPRTYVFVFCPFQNVTQHEPTYAAWTRAERKAKTNSVNSDSSLPDAPAPILLGIWSEWTASPLPTVSAQHARGLVGSNMGDTRMQRYDYGHQCTNGQHREVRVTITCGATNRIVSVDEPAMCVYALAFETPAACDDRERVALERALEREQRTSSSIDSSAAADASAAAVRDEL